MSQEPFTKENSRSKFAYLSHSRNGRHPSATTEETLFREEEPALWIKSEKRTSEFDKWPRTAIAIEDLQPYLKTAVKEVWLDLVSAIKEELQSLPAQALSPYCTANSSNKVRPASRKRRRTWRCYICDDIHHFAKDCPFLEMAQQIVQLEKSKAGEPREEELDASQGLAEGNAPPEDGKQEQQEVLETNTKCNYNCYTGEDEEEETARTESGKVTPDRAVRNNHTASYNVIESKGSESQDVNLRGPTVTPKGTELADMLGGSVIATDSESEEETNSQEGNTEFQSDRHTESANAFKKEKKTNKKEKSRIPNEKANSTQRKKANPNMVNGTVDGRNGIILPCGVREFVSERRDLMFLL